MSVRIALIHATPLAIDPIVAAFAAAWPEARLMNLLDDSLSADLAEDGELTPAMVDRFHALAAYGRGCGADGILFTCSAFGRAIEAVREMLPIPVLKPNEAMFEEALSAGSRLAMLATFAPSIPSMIAEFEEMSAGRTPSPELSTHEVEGALDAMKAGDPERHDALIAETASGLSDRDAVILAQFSMARAATRIPSGVRVLTSPDSAVRRMKQLLAA
ncbi:MAG: aspartate/glutamate racemase family protein [Acetobacterales bacterium]